MSEEDVTLRTSGNNPAKIARVEVCNADEGDESIPSAMRAEASTDAYRAAPSNFVTLGKFIKDVAAGLGSEAPSSAKPTFLAERIAGRGSEEFDMSKFLLKLLNKDQQERDLNSLRQSECDCRSCTKENDLLEMFGKWDKENAERVAREEAANGGKAMETNVDEDVADLMKIYSGRPESVKADVAKSTRLRDISRQILSTSMREVIAFRRGFASTLQESEKKASGNDSHATLRDTRDDSGYRKSMGHA